MDVIDILINILILAVILYLSFGMALAGWFTALRKGEAVTLIPQREGRSGSTRSQVLIVVVSLAACLLLILLLWIPLPIPFSYSILQWLKVIGVILFFTGAGFILWARRKLEAMWGISTSREVKLLAGHTLVRTGPYAFIRHPMYFGWWTAVLGLLFLYRTWIILVMLAFSLVVFAGRARKEEKVLAERFGEEWKSYSAVTKFLIPFLY